MPEDAPQPVETEPETASQKVDFPCPNCGAKMTWDPQHDSLACDYCESKIPVPRAEGTIVERSLEDAGSAARGLGVAGNGLGGGTGFAEVRVRPGGRPSDQRTQHALYRLGTRVMRRVANAGHHGYVGLDAEA